MNFLRVSNPVQAVMFLTSGLLFFQMAPAFAQDYPPQPGYPAQGYPAQQNYAPPPAFAPDQLNNLVSRIALYPDPLLAQIFAAATFPDQIPDAARFAGEHQNLRGNDLADQIEAANLPFDPAVQALIPFPQVLDTMARDMNWTNDLGNAVLADRAAVMDAVQRERESAQRYGYLQNTPQMRVVGGPGEIQIEPVDPAVIYVPVYDPYLVFAPPRQGFYVGSAIRYSPGFAIGFGFSNWGWGGGFNWVSHSVIVHDRVWDRDWYNRGSYARYNGGNFRSGYENRDVTINHYGVNRTVNRADYNVNRTVNRPEYNVNRPDYGNNYGRTNNVQNSERNFYRGGQPNTVAPNPGFQRNAVAPNAGFQPQAQPDRPASRQNDNGRFDRGSQPTTVAPNPGFQRNAVTPNAGFQPQAQPDRPASRQNDNGRFDRGSQPTTVAPNAGFQRQAEPRQAFRPSESGRIERGFASPVRQNYGGGERERGGRR